MSFEAYWKRFTKKNPQVLKAGNLTTSAERFRLCMVQAYETGRRDGELAAFGDKSLFQRIFG